MCISRSQPGQSLFCSIRCVRIVFRHAASLFAEAPHRLGTASAQSSEKKACTGWYRPVSWLDNNHIFMEEERSVPFLVFMV